VTLEESLKAFHLPKPNGWGHSTEVRVFAVMNRAKKRIKQEGHECTEQDEIDLLWYLHGAWDRLLASENIYGIAEKELHSIIVARLERGYEEVKRMDEESANRLMKNVDKRKGI